MSKVRFVNENIFEEESDEDDKPLKYYRKCFLVALPLKNIKLMSGSSVNSEDILKSHYIQRDGKQGVMGSVSADVKPIFSIVANVDTCKLEDRIQIAVKDDKNNRCPSETDVDLYTISDYDGEIEVTIKAGDLSAIDDETNRIVQIDNRDVPNDVYYGCAYLDDFKDKNELKLALELRMPEQELVAIINELKSNSNGSLNLLAYLAGYVHEIDDFAWEPGLSRRFFLAGHKECYIRSLFVSNIIEPSGVASPQQDLYLDFDSPNKKLNNDKVAVELEFMRYSLSDDLRKLVSQVSGINTLLWAVVVVQFVFSVLLFLAVL